MITFDELWEIFEKEIPNKILKNNGLSIFAVNRAKFEAWLKVEIIDTLDKNNIISIPEQDRIDIVIGKNDWAIELKIVATNYKSSISHKKTKNITKNIQSICNDCSKLKDSSYQNKTVLFISFPLELPNCTWEEHLGDIRKNLKDLEHKEFAFYNGVKSVLYFGLLK